MRDDAGPMPAAAVLLAYFALSLMDAMIKALSDSFSVGQIVALRYCFGAGAALPFLWVADRPRLDAAILGASGVRAVVIVIAAGSFFYALSVVPLAEATALAFTAPLFLVIFARLILGERIPPVAVVSIAIGFAGVVVMVLPRLSGPGSAATSVAGAACVLLAALCYALLMVLTRLHSTRAGAANMVFAQTAIAAVLTAPLLLVVWRPMALGDLFAFATVGLLGSLSHLGLAWGFSRANAARLSPLEYSVLPWAIVFGFLFFAEIPTVNTLLGAVMIVAACMLILLRQLKAGAG